MMAVASARLAGLAGSCAPRAAVANSAKASEIGLMAFIAEFLDALGGRNVQTSSEILTMFSYSAPTRRSGLTRCNRRVKSCALVQRETGPGGNHPALFLRGGFIVREDFCAKDHSPEADF